MVDKLLFKTFSIDIRMVLLMFLLFCPFLTEAQQERHYLHYKFTALSKADTLPEFSAVVVVDYRQIKHYSNEERDWILTANDKTNAPENPPDRDWFLHQMKILSNCTDSQCFELHVLQRIIGCELEKFSNGTVSLTAFDEYGFDGEDFIAFNSDNMQWIDKNPKAKETKKKWDQQTRRNRFLKYFFNTCMDWISTFNYTKKYTSSLDVHIFATEYSQSKFLTCLATGFYPRDVEVNIRFAGNIIEDQTSSGIRPNEDGSFQLSTHVEIDRKDEKLYDCLVIYPLRKPIVEYWDGTCIGCKTNYTWMVLAGVASALAAFGILFALLYRDAQYRKQFYPYKPHEWMLLMSIRYSYERDSGPTYIDWCGREKNVL